MKIPRSFRILASLVVAAALVAAAGYLLLGPRSSAEPPQDEPSSAGRTVRGRMQARPGGPMEDVEVAVHEVPTDLPTVPAEEAPLEDDDLVLGVVVDAQAVAFPIRYLAMFEVVDSRVGETPVAPTW